MYSTEIQPGPVLIPIDLGPSKFLLKDIYPFIIRHFKFIKYFVFLEPGSRVKHCIFFSQDLYTVMKVAVTFNLLFLLIWRYFGAC